MDGDDVSGAGESLGVGLALPELPPPWRCQWCVAGGDEDPLSAEDGDGVGEVEGGMGCPDDEDGGELGGTIRPVTGGGVPRCSTRGPGDDAALACFEADR